MLNLKKIIAEKPVNLIRGDVDEIKKNYFKLRKTEEDAIRQKFLDSGEDEVSFEMPKDTDEDYLKELLADFKKRKEAYNLEQEKLKLDNLNLKREIIKKISLLANSEESLNKTFSDFKELQRKWNQVGLVPHSESKILLSAFNIEIERFYDYIKINKELRDLDFKKNLVFKLNLCEKAESLLLESDIVGAYKTLQIYHETWRDAGPVSREKREDLWERFQLISRELNKKHQDHFLKIKDEREANLKKKEILCEQAEVIANQANKSFDDWNKNTKQILDFQKMWKTIGMVPRQVNSVIYERFRKACNKFFDEKKEFFLIEKEREQDNLQQKVDLCVQAESMVDSTDWKKTTETYLSLQKKWKTTGPVSRKYSNDVWKRFRLACDTFFNAKSDYFGNREKELKDNLDLKNSLIAEILSYEPAGDHAGNVSKIKELQTKWSGIGFVPFRDKEKLQKNYRAAVDALYQKLNMSKDDVDESRYRERIELYVATGEKEKISKERIYLSQKITTLKSDISLWENNLSFFSGKADGLLKDVNDKLDNAREEIESLTEKKKIINVIERSFNKEKKTSDDE